MAAANSCPVAQRTTIPAHRMADPAAAVAIARVMGFIQCFILSLVSQAFMGFIRSFLSLPRHGFTTVSGRARDNKRTRLDAGPSSS